jgi:hypothetical protein
MPTRIQNSFFLCVYVFVCNARSNNPNWPDVIRQQKLIEFNQQFWSFSFLRHSETRKILKNSNRSTTTSFTPGGYYQNQNLQINSPSWKWKWHPSLTNFSIHINVCFIFLQLNNMWDRERTRKVSKHFRKRSKILVIDFQFFFWIFKNLFGWNLFLIKNFEINAHMLISQQQRPVNFCHSERRCHRNQKRKKCSFNQEHR